MSGKYGSELIEVYSSILSAAEISRATLEMVFNDEMVENGDLSWILAGVLEQVVKISEEVERIEKIRCGCVVA